MREIMRSLLSANLMITGILLFIGSIITFYGTTFMLNATNLGKRLAFLVVGAGTFGWAMINSFLFILLRVSWKEWFSAYLAISLIAAKTRGGPDAR